MSQAIPYIYSLDTEHAADYYLRIFGPQLVSFERKEYSDNPHKTRKCKIHFAGTTLYAADVDIDLPKERSIAINLEFDNIETQLAEKVASIMENCGEFEILTKYELQTWGLYHGVYKDKFGVTWMVSTNDK